MVTKVDMRLDGINHIYDKNILSAGWIGAGAA